MKRTLLCTALVSLFCTGVYADTNVPPTTPSTPATIQPPAPNPSTLQTPTTNPSTLPTPSEGAKESSIPAPQAATVVDCQYRIPAETTSVDQSIISTWAEKAVVQSFDFNAASMDDQLTKLKLCFTDQGWESFNDALQKSGNLNAIKTQQLTVSSQTDGSLKINPVKENQWKVTVPLQVVYQNDKEKITQLLSVDLLVGRKVSGDLGIMQIIATPRAPAGSQPDATAAKGTSPGAAVTDAENQTNTSSEPPASAQDE